MLSKFKSLYTMIRISVSPGFSARVAKRYWSTTDKTHREVTDSQFRSYYEKIHAIITPPRSTSASESNAATSRDREGAVSTQLILDYGCGGGEIAKCFADDGYSIECSDLAEHFVQKARKLGLVGFEHEALFESETQYDVIYMNGVFFYVHPRARVALLGQLRKKLKDGGKLFILDEPDLTKRMNLNLPWAFHLMSGLTSVYHIEAAAFFNDPKQTRQQAGLAGFEDVEIKDSWNDYRTHFILSA